MVFQAKVLKHEVLESELEALLVEAELIRTHQPPFNILLKDDKSDLYVNITDEKFPRVITIRKKEAEKLRVQGTTLGPFPSAYTLKEVLGIARRIFPFCTGPRTPNYGTSANSPCFHYHLDQCPGACIGLISVERYRETISELVLFLKGKKRSVVKQIEAEMTSVSEKEEFEYAAKLRDRVESIRSVTEKKVRLKPDLQMPRLKESIRAEGIIQLRRILCKHMQLPKTYPLTRIEGYDVSNIQGTNATVAQVTFINGSPAKEHYRLYNIRTVQTPNDYAMLQEAIVRRQNHLEWGIPNLLVIDGGKGQLRAALKVWNWSVPVISLAKKPDRVIIPLLKVEKDKDPLVGLEYQEISLPEQHPALTLLQQIRDESHRFSKKQHTRLRTKAMME